MVEGKVKEILDRTEIDEKIKEGAAKAEEKVKEVLEKTLPLLEAEAAFSNDALFEKLKAFAADNGLKNGQIMWPIRTAVSGKEMTPGGATQLLEILGKEESLARIRAAIEKLSR